MSHITIYNLYKSTHYRAEHGIISQSTFRRWVQSGKISTISMNRQTIYVIVKNALPSHPYDKHPHRWTIDVFAEIMNVGKATVKNWEEKGYIRIYTEDEKIYVDKEFFTKFINKKNEKNHHA